MTNNLPSLSSLKVYFLWKVRSYHCNFSQSITFNFVLNSVFLRWVIFFQCCKTCNWSSIPFIIHYGKAVPLLKQLWVAVWRVPAEPSDLFIYFVHGMAGSHNPSGYRSKGLQTSDASLKVRLNPAGVPTQLLQTDIISAHSTSWLEVVWLWLLWCLVQENTLCSSAGLTDMDLATLTIHELHGFWFKHMKSEQTLQGLVCQQKLHRQYLWLQLY